MNPGLHRIATFTAAVAIVVIVFGAFVRLSNAGLSCPDWPGCYGHLTWPDRMHEIESANLAYPNRPVEIHKAWREMTHRYLAGLLVLLVVWINVLAWHPINRHLEARGLAAGILALILLQAALGMWTVTLKLVPIVVLAHLLGGMATMALIAWLAMRTGTRDDYAPVPTLRNTRPWILIALIILATQIMLGGWTSANYAALACPDLPGCQGSVWPDADYREGFTLWRKIGVDYEGGVLDMRARIAIHYAHRIGAAVTAIVLLLVGVHLLKSPLTRRGGVVLIALLLAQIVLGILNVALFLPLPNAVMHQAVAALLLLCLVFLLHRSLAKVN